MSQVKIEEVLKDLSLENIAALDATTIYAADNLDKIINTLKEKTAEAIKIGDLSDDKGRKAIASRAHKVSRYKTTLDDKGEELVAEAKQTVKAVGEIRKSLREKLDTMRDEIRQPLTDWEEAEAKRQAEIEARMKAMLDCMIGRSEIPAIEEAMRRVSELYQFDWQEFGELAETNYATVKNCLDDKLAAQKKYEEDQAELKRLRDEKAARDEEDRKARELAAAAIIAPPIEPRPEVANVSTPPPVTPVIDTQAAVESTQQAKAAAQEGVMKITYTDLVNAIREMKPLIPAGNLVRLQHHTQKIIESIMKEPA